MPTPQPEWRDALDELLAHVYTKARPALARSRHSAWDVFNHRVRFSTGAATLGAFISRLSNCWGIQSLPIRAQALLDGLEHYEDAVLRYLQQEHVPACMRAIIIAKQMKEDASAKRSQDRGDSRGPIADAPLWGREDGLDADAPETDGLE